MTKSDLERAFLFHWHIHAEGYPEPEYNYRFAAIHAGGIGKGVRKRLEEAGLKDWELDFAWPDTEYREGLEIKTWHKRVAVEVHGGTWTQGRHVRGQGFRNDREKMNAAILLGWRVFEYTTGMLEDDPEKCIGQVKEALDDESP